MSPEYNEGDFVVILRNPLFGSHPSKGDEIIFKHVHYGTLIKKIVDILPNGDYYVKGIQENSLDSNKLGYIPSSTVMGKVIWHIRKK
jgi:phage repressor protein C with HTH and peptisase S24 domain